MTKSLILAAALALSSAALPALAQEGNGDPFAYRAPGVTSRTSAVLTPDVGSASYPNVYGRPGSNLSVPSGEVVGQANEAPVQTANSEPRGFTSGTMAFASQPSQYFMSGGVN